MSGKRTLAEPRRSGLWTRRALMSLGGGYALLTAGATLAQRRLLFTTGGGEELAAAGGIAIPGSERVVLTASDGVRLAAWYRPPQPGKPVLLYMHGRRGRLAGQIGRWRRIAEAGAGVMAFSYRGYPGSEGSPSEAGLGLDAVAAYQWLRTRQPAENIVLHGFSLGSSVAVQLATHAHAKALVLEAPFTSAVDVAAAQLPLFPVSALMWDQFRSCDSIGGLRMPILVVHGDRDSVIPFAHGEALFALASEPKRFVRMPGSDHNTLPRDGLYPLIWRFLAEIDQQAASEQAD